MESFTMIKREQMTSPTSAAHPSPEMVTQVIAPFISKLNTFPFRFPTVILGYVIATRRYYLTQVAVFGIMTYTE